MYIHKDGPIRILVAGLARNGVERKYPYNVNVGHDIVLRTSTLWQAYHTR
jgi:hypothetical protein